jgi:integrase
VKLSIGILQVTLPYSYQRGKVIYYQRAIPGDLQERCAAKRVKIKLDTENIVLAAKQIKSINSGVEAEWKAMRLSPDALPKTIKGKAEDLLRVWDLFPRPSVHDDDAASMFLSHLDTKREKFSRGDDQTYREASPTDYLQPHEIEAVQLLAGTSRPRLSDALELYLKVSPKRNNEKFTTYARRSYGRMVEAIGDKVIEEVTRDDGHTFVTKMLSEGLASASIRRLLNTDRAVLETYIKEKQLNRSNPFASIPVPDEGEDAEEAVPYTAEERGKLVSTCKQWDDEPRWLLAMIADTGSRLAEIAGIPLKDIHLDSPIPYIDIKPHPWRSLKNKASGRSVPLVGVSLWAAQRVVSSVVEGQSLAFPQYNKGAKTNSNSASAALNKWIKTTVELDHIIHELRHTMADRLREVQCPADIRLAIGGWKVSGVGEGYGDGYTLRVRREWLDKVSP